jgi:hypothetical protein
MPAIFSTSATSSPTAPDRPSEYLPAAGGYDLPGATEHLIGLSNTLMAYGAKSSHREMAQRALRLPTVPGPIGEDRTTESSV